MSEKNTNPAPKKSKKYNGYVYIVLGIVVLIIDSYIIIKNYMTVPNYSITEGYMGFTYAMGLLGGCYCIAHGINFLQSYDDRDMI